MHFLKFPTNWVLPLCVVNAKIFGQYTLQEIALLLWRDVWSSDVVGMVKNYSSASFCTSSSKIMCMALILLESNFSCEAPASTFWWRRSYMPLSIYCIAVVIFTCQCTQRHIRWHCSSCHLLTWQTVCQTVIADSNCDHNSLALTFHYLCLLVVSLHKYLWRHKVTQIYKLYTKIHIYIEKMKCKNFQVEMRSALSWTDFYEIGEQRKQY